MRIPSAAAAKYARTAPLYRPKPTRESRANRFMYATRPSTIAMRPSSVSSWCVPCEPDASACSSASALAGRDVGGDDRAAGEGDLDPDGVR